MQVRLHPLAAGRRRGGPERDHVGLRLGASERCDRRLGARGAVDERPDGDGGRDCVHRGEDGGERRGVGCGARCSRSRRQHEVAKRGHGLRERGGVLRRGVGWLRRAGVQLHKQLHPGGDTRERLEQARVGRGRACWPGDAEPDEAKPELLCRRALGGIVECRPDCECRLSCDRRDGRAAHRVLRGCRTDPHDREGVERRAVPEPVGGVDVYRVDARIRR